MTTKRLVIDLIAFFAVTLFLLFFVPFALNAHDTLTNLAGVALIIGLVITGVATVHRQLTQTNEDKNEE